MRNQLFKITLALMMLLVMAVPAQAFAAENCDTQTAAAKSGNYIGLYQQVKQQINKAGITAPAAKAEEKATAAKQTPTAVPAKAAAPATTAAPAKTQAAAPAAQPEKSTAVPASAKIGAYEQQVADLVNKERAAAGLPALKVNTKLAGVAEKKAEDLRDKNYFDHNSPTYGSPFDMMKQFGISYQTAGENIAKGQKTPEAVMNGWMNSPGHRANILNANYTEIGVGYVTDSNGGTYWVQMFIRP